MTTTPGPSAPTRPVRTFMMDFALALLVFTAVVGALSVTNGNAFPAPPPPDLLPPALALAQPVAYVPPMTISPPAFPMVESHPSQLITALLALTFASLTAFNLAVWRHLRTAYASPRRRS